MINFPGINPVPGFAAQESPFSLRSTSHPLFVTGTNARQVLTGRGFYSCGPPWDAVGAIAPKESQP